MHSAINQNRFITPPKKKVRPPREDRTFREPEPLGSDRPNVLCLEALRPLGHFELHLLTLGQRAEAVRRDGAVVAENVLTAIVLRDEPKALRIVEPLHCSSSHVAVLPS